MKQLLRFSILLLALLLPVAAAAYDFEVDGIYYNINGNEATVTFRGLHSYSFYNEYSGSVVIPATVTHNGTTYPVTSIGEFAFSECSELTSIDLPNSITEIGQVAFGDCPGLTSIVIESGNPRYDSRNNCNAIIETANNTLIVGCKNTTIPNSVTAIGPGAFYGCTGLTSIDIPNSVTAIGHWAFCGCEGLTSIVIPNLVTEIYDGAFSCCYELRDVYCYIADLSRVSSGNELFNLLNFGNYSGRTLHVPQGTADAYRADKNWYPYFGQIVEIVSGDVNRDNETNIADVNATIDIILGGSGNAGADVNGDGEINIADINAVINIILGGPQN